MTENNYKTKLKDKNE